MKVVLVVAFCFFLTICFFGVILYSECAPDEKEFEKALDLMERKDYPRSIEILEILISKAESPETRNKYRYVIATCHRKLEHWTEAVSCYESVLGEGESPFSDLARLHIATGYRNLYDYGMAIEWYKTILRDYSDSFSAVEALYQLGECYFTVKQYDAAINHYSKFIESYPEENRVRTAIYKIGCAYQELKMWSEAYAQYQEVIRENMKDEIARSALDKIKLIISAQPKISITRDDRMYYGLALYYSRQYKAAREELEKVIGDPDSSSAKAAYFIAESYYRERKYTTAIGKYTAVGKNYPQSDYAVSSQYQIALCYWKIGREGASNASLAKFSATYPENSLADNAMFQIAENYYEKEQYKKAADAYGKVASKYPTSSLSDDSLWKMGWCYMKLKDNGKSEQAFRHLLNEHSTSQLAGSARFWIGMIHEKEGKFHAAVDSYKDVIQNRDWYYSDRARRRIESLVSHKKIDKDIAFVQYETAEIDESVPAWSEIADPIPTRTRELLYLRIFDDAIGELLMSVEAAVALDSAYYYLSFCYEKIGNFNKSWAYAWRLSQLPGMKGEDGGMPRQIYRMLYPIAYKDTVFSNSQKNSLDQFLMLSLMLEESRYNPDALSPVGAMGLTQIMPTTGKDIAQRIKIPQYKTEMLLQSKTNIKMGSWYLGHLSSRLSDHVQKIFTEKKTAKQDFDHSDIVKILAVGAYNGGESRVRRWVEKFGIEDIDEFVENIPIYETKRYIKKVCNSYEMYKSVYQN